MRQGVIIRLDTRQRDRTSFFLVHSVAIFSQTTSRCGHRRSGASERTGDRAQRSARSCCAVEVRLAGAACRHSRNGRKWRPVGDSSTLSYQTAPRPTTSLHDKEAKRSGEVSFPAIRNLQAAGSLALYDDLAGSRIQFDLANVAAGAVNLLGYESSALAAVGLFAFET